MANIGKMLEKAATSAVQSVMNRAARKVVSGAIDISTQKIVASRNNNREISTVTGQNGLDQVSKESVTSAGDCELGIDFFMTPGTSRGMASRAFNVCSHYNVGSAVLLSQTDPSWFKRTYGVGDGTIDVINNALLQAGFGNSNFCVGWERSRSVVVKRH